jgi:hypothetical protein
MAAEFLGSPGFVLACLRDVFGMGWKKGPRLVVWHTAVNKWLASAFSRNVFTRTAVKNDEHYRPRD